MFKRASSGDEAWEWLGSDRADAFVHFVGYSEETASDLALRASQFPDKLVAVVGTTARIVQEYLAELTARDAAFIVTISGFEQIGQQLEAERLRRAPLYYAQVIMGHLFPNLHRGPNLERECVYDLFLRYPFRAPPKETPAAARLRRCERMLAESGLASTATIRSCLFVIGFLVYVVELGVDASTAARYVGAKDKRSACAKACRVLKKLDFAAVSSMRIEDVIALALMHGLIDVERYQPLPQFETPPNVLAMRALRDGRRTAARMEVEAMRLPDELARQTLSLVEPVISKAIPNHLLNGGGKRIVMAAVKARICLKWGRYVVVDENGSASLSKSATELCAIAHTMTVRAHIDWIRSRWERQRKRTVPLIDEAVDVENMARPEDVDIWAEERELLRAAINSLPEPTRQILELSIKGFKRSEIARLLKRNVGWVSDMKARAIVFLKQRLG